MVAAGAAAGKARRTGVCIAYLFCVYLFVFIKLHVTAQFDPCHPSDSVLLASVLPRRSMVLVTKTSAWPEATKGTYTLSKVIM